MHELRFAARALAKNPGFTLVAMLSLAIGIGANSAIFSLADGLLLRPLPVAGPNDVVTVSGRRPGLAPSNISYRDYVDFRDNNRTFQGLIAYNDVLIGFAQKADSLPKMQLGMAVSGNFFQVLGVQPVLGRAFRPEEDQTPGRDHVVVLGHDAWQTQFGSDAGVLGRRIRLNGTEFTIIGVAPEEFTSLDQYTRIAFFVPAMMAGAVGMGQGNNDLWEKRDQRAFEVKGRLKPGVSLAQAEADLAGIAKGLAERYQDTNRDQTVAVRTELQTRIERSPIDAALTWTLMGLVGLVLLIACSNVANLMLSRGRERAHEIAIRLAIGCSRARLIRQLLTESLLIALAGGAVGLLVAFAGVRFFSQIRLPTDLPISITARLDERVLLFTLFASVVSAALFGLIPALQTTKAEVTPALKNMRNGAARSRFWGRNTLVAAQVSISLVLMVSALTLFRGFRMLIMESPGFRTDHMLLMTFEPSLIRYSADQTREFYKQILERARNTPGVKSASLSRAIPISTNQYLRDVVPEGYEFPRGKESDTTFGTVVADGFFETMGVPVLRGRGFTTADTADTQKVALVNEAFAEKYWPGKDALGKRFRVGGKDGDWVQVLGVTKTGKYLWIAETPTPYFYLPLTQNPQTRLTLVTQSIADSASIAEPLREVARSLDPNVPVFDIRTMEDLYNLRAVATPSIIVETVGAMGVMGMLLAMFGLYALVAYSVSRRTREIGIRMAIGADRTSVLRMVLRQGLVLGVSGVLVGLVLSVASSQVLLSAFNAEGVDPVSYVLVVGGLVAVTVAASIVPATRASKVDPIRALRYE